jgi:hypothetical protein
MFAIGIGFVLAYSVKDWLFHLLTAPADLGHATG